jgi:hypothetical protein
MAIYLFNPNGGTNHVLVHDITSNTNVFNDDVSSSAIKVTGFTSGHSYFVLSASGSGGTGNFSYAVSSHANSTSYPLPFWSYTQFYTNTRTQGPSDGVVVIIAEEPTM